MSRRLPLALILFLPACASSTSATHSTAPPEAITPDNQILTRSPLAPDSQARLELKLEDAARAHRADPTDEMRIIWLGRRTAYLGRYRESIDIFSRGLVIHPDSAKLLRHRGHRYITTRRFDEAITDLSRAAELERSKPDQVEPDGLPNKFNKPRSTLHSNIYYHLALAHYLKGDFARAADLWRHDYIIATNDDTRVATSYWLYLSLRRAGDDAEAMAVLDRIEDEMDVIENFTYHSLLLSFKGRTDAQAANDSALAAGVEDATLLYGRAAFALVSGRQQEAEALLNKVTSSSAWAAFGYIAAEADLRRQAEARAD